MKTIYFKLVQRLTLSACIGLALNVSLAFAACAFAYRGPFSFSNETIGTEPEFDGRSWNWLVNTNWAITTVNQQIARPIEETEGAKFASAHCRSNQKPGKLPWWASATENPIPPDVESIAPNAIRPGMWDIGYGWPARCLSSRFSLLNVRKTSAENTASQQANGMSPGASNVEVEPVPIYAARYNTILTKWGSHDGWWPTRILWTGMLANTGVISASVFVALSVGPWYRTIRSSARKHRGECSACGYTRDGLPGTPGETRCPECGFPASSADLNSFANDPTRNDHCHVQDSTSLTTVI